MALQVNTNSLTRDVSPERAPEDMVVIELIEKILKGYIHKL